MKDWVKNGVLAIGDGYRAKNIELGGDGPIFLRGAYLQDNGWEIHDPERLHTEGKVFGTKIAQLGDTVLTTKGNSLGRLGFVNEAIAGAVYSPHLSYWRSLDHEVVDPRFLYYWASSKECLNQVRAKSYSTDMAPYLSLADQESISFFAPPIEQQRFAADLLGSLDKKIALNQQMAKTLEAIARAMFQSWFVDFDPVHRAAAGQETGLPPRMAALFPARLTEDGLPEGWQMRQVGDVFDIVAGNTPSTEDARFWGGPHAWTTPKDLSRLSVPVSLESERTLSDEGLLACSSGLVPRGTLLLSSRAPIGYLGFAEIPTAINQGIAAFRRKNLSTSFAWAWCQAEMPRIKANANGSTFLEISKGSLRRLPMIQAKEPVMQAFVELVDPLVERMVTIARENVTLTTLRDMLLPKLMSGELRIRDTEKIAESA